jgi:hypothetical protein
LSAGILDGHLAEREDGPFRVIVGERVPAGLVEVVIDNDGRAGSFGVRALGETGSTSVVSAVITIDRRCI